MSRTVLFVAIAAALGLAAVVTTPSTSKQTAVITNATTQEVPALVMSGPPVSPLAQNLEVPSTVYATTEAPVQLTAKLSHPVVSTGVNEVYAEISLTAAQAEKGPRRPVSLALVIDRSGSMHGDKLNRAKEAALKLIDQLAPSDRLAIIHYGGDVVALPSLEATAANKAKMIDFVSRIVDSGDTNIGAGLDQASTELTEKMKDYSVNRIILLSDGQPTSGLVNPESLVLAVGELRRHGFTVSALGVGADFNETLMSQMANNGGGFYGYIENSEGLADVFTRELEQATSTVARGVWVTLTVPQGVELMDVFGRKIDPGSRTVQIPLYDLASGQQAKVLARLHVNAPAGEGHISVLTAQLSYQTVSTGANRTSNVDGVATFTADETKVTPAMDREVAAAGIKALGAVTMTKAAVAYQEGRTEEALGMFDNVRALFGASADSLGGSTAYALSGVDEVQNNLQTAHTADQLSHQVKLVQKKGLKDFGNNNTY
ncbi:MAG: vWA domain-containing protein [Myxococcaceae bacterium]